MIWQHLNYIIPLFASTLVSLIVALYAWQRRNVTGGNYFVLLMVFVAVWSFTSMGEMTAAAIPAKILWSKLSYLGITNIAPLWLLFTLHYSQRTAWLTWRRIALMWVIPAIVLGLAFTNELHRLVWPNITPVSDVPGDLLVYGHGPGVWLSAAYSYTLILIGSLFLIRTVLQSHQLYRLQVYVLLFGVAIPLVGNILYLTKIIPLPGLDFTPIAFSLTGTIVAFGFFRWQILNTIPIARDAIIENMRDSILVLDNQDRIVDINPATCKMLKCSPIKVFGKPIGMLIPSWDSLVSKLKSTPVVNIELPLRNNLWVDLRITPLLNKHGHAIGKLIVARDITAKRQSDIRLKINMHELESRNAELDAFAHTVAHDLKTPLTVLIGYSTMLEGAQEPIEPSQLDEIANQISRTSTKMENIINELLVLATVRKISQITLQALEMGIIVAEVKNRLEKVIEESSAKIQIPENWPIAFGHQPWVEQVWMNYISNAIKYGGTPPIVELGYDQPGKSSKVRSQIRFWVRDNGRGLTKKEQSKLFIEFSRLEQVRAKGYGLGLSIVQRIVEKMGGKVGVKSSVGKGSTFFFTLPAAQETHK